MRAKFKLREIESSRDFSVNEILTKKGEPTGYNAEAVKYYDGSVNYWRIRNTRTNMWKRCESEKELFSTLEKIKSDPEYAEKFGEILLKNPADKNQKIEKVDQKDSADTRTTEDKKKNRKIGFIIFFILCAVGLVMAAAGGCFNGFFKVLMVIIILVAMPYIGAFGLLLLFFYPVWILIKIMLGL